MLSRNVRQRVIPLQGIKTFLRTLLIDQGMDPYFKQGYRYPGLRWCLERLVTRPDR